MKLPNKVTLGYLVAVVYIAFPLATGMFGYGQRDNYAIGDKLMNGFAVFGYGVIGIALWWYFSDSVKDKRDGALILFAFFAVVAIQYASQ